MANVITIWSQFFITDSGLRLRQQTIATGAELTFCFAKIGQGVPINPANIPLMTDIVSAAEEVPVVRSVAEGVTHHVGVRVDNKDFEQPVLMTEIGLFAKIGEEEPVLYGYTYATQGYDSIPAGNVSHYIWTIGIDTVISRAQSILFNYDGNEVYATEEEIDRLIQAFDAFKVEFTKDVQKQLADFDGASIILQDLVIPTASWIASGESEYGYVAEVGIEECREAYYPDVAIHKDSLKTAFDADVCASVQSLDGKLRFWAKRVPAKDISATAALLISGISPANPGGSAESGCDIKSIQAKLNEKEGI